MNMHKSLRVTPSDRRNIWKLYSSNAMNVSELASFFRVSRPTIYKVVERARLQQFVPRDSTNKRYRNIRYGLKRLAKIEKSIEDKLRAKAKRYNKKYPGEMLHLDTKRLPLLKGETKKMDREYLFVAIDDYSRELYAAILPDKSQFSSSKFLHDTLEQCPYTIECSYTDNGTEYKGSKEHAYVKLCKNNGINQKFTQTARPQTNGKAERVIRTTMEMWHSKQFKDRDDRKVELNRFINYYNTVKPHKGINNKTPYELLEDYFFDHNSS